MKIRNRERERERETDKETDRQRERQRERERETPYIPGKGCNATHSETEVGIDDDSVLGRAQWCDGRVKGGPVHPEKHRA